MTYLDGLTYLSFLPWLAALVMALCFGALAVRAGDNWVLWACGGACFGLLTTTIVLGVSEAAFIPMSHDAVLRFQTKSIAVSGGLLLVFGWIFSANLHGHHLPLWHALRRLFAKPSAPTATR